MKRSYSVEKSFLNTRLDKWFKRNVNDVPQSLIEKNIRKGNIRVNNSKKKSSYKLQENDEIILKNINFKNKIINKITNYIPTKKEVTYSSSLIIENNENFIVINKPPGIAVQSGTKSKRNVIDILRKTKEFVGYTPFLVHRIDKETTGILIVAKNREYAQLFTSLFRIRKIYKSYLAIILGSLEKKNGKFIDTLYHYEGKKKNEYNAISRYKVLSNSNNYTFLKLNPETGRKHQLRKQLLLRGYPIFGDSKYRFAKNKVNKKQNLMLHSSEIFFTIKNIRYNFSADIPDYFKKFLNEKNLKNF